jgi:hypothetical protein
VAAVAILLFVSLVAIGVVVWKYRRLKMENRGTKPDTRSAIVTLTAETPTRETSTGAASASPQPSQNGPSSENAESHDSNQDVSPVYNSPEARETTAPSEYAALESVYHEINENQMRR